ncbi:hypothetical protein Leryth_013591 [Lithospermum erythrorhizon]|nr:hypothetical protein Leryth_013591 [Lithospermum erythrorhizon]
MSYSSSSTISFGDKDSKKHSTKTKSSKEPHKSKESILLGPASAASRVHQSKSKVSNSRQSYLMNKVQGGIIKNSI